MCSDEVAKSDVTCTMERQSKAKYNVYGCAEHAKGGNVQYESGNAQVDEEVNIEVTCALHSAKAWQGNRLMFNAKCGDKARQCSMQIQNFRFEVGKVRH